MGKGKGIFWIVSALDHFKPIRLKRTYTKKERTKMNNEHIRLHNLERIRKEHSFTREELSKLSGINEFTIQALETGINDAFNVKLST